MIMDQAVGGFKKGKGGSAGGDSGGAARSGRPTSTNEKAGPCQHAKRRWVAHSRTSRALDVVFTLYFSEQISDREGARGSA
jgi:hypothetical protein